MSTAYGSAAGSCLESDTGSSGGLCLKLTDQISLWSCRLLVAFFLSLNSSLLFIKMCTGVDERGISA